MDNVSQTIPVITIDGPAGSGKGTIAQAVASQLAWNILDSGALYRLVALATKCKNIGLQDEIAVTKIARSLDVEFLTSDHSGVKIFLEGEEVTQAIRSEACGCDASLVATNKQVRIALLERQRAFQLPPGLVADGRDMGTVVFPDAKVKIFLTASPEIRGKRRQNQLKQQGIDANLGGLIRDIEARDKRDRQRKDAPLVPADDAQIIDTGKLSIDDVVSQVLEAANKAY